jgi:hypothetical protein
MKEMEPQASLEEAIQTLIDRLEISEGIHYEFYQRGPWFKQYGNTSDPDGEYEVRLNKESIDTASEAKNKLLELGDKQPELLGQIIRSLVNKELPPDETHYLISRTETGFQKVEPQPGEAGWAWISGTETRKMIQETVLGFGPKAIPHLEKINTKVSKELIAKIKRQEFGQKLRNIFH